MCSKDLEVRQRTSILLPIVLLHLDQINNCLKWIAQRNRREHNLYSANSCKWFFNPTPQKSPRSQITTSRSLKISDLLLHRLCSPASGCSGTACECCIENPPQAARGTSGVTRRRPTYSGHNEERGALGAFSSVSCDGGWELFKALLKHEYTEKGLSCEEQGPNIRLQEPWHLSLPCHRALFPPWLHLPLELECCWNYCK